MASQRDYDHLVIGAAHGAKVAIAEEHRIGGTCVIRGCVPKKLLVYGAHFAEDLEDARRFGWHIEGAKFVWPTLRDNVLAEVTRLSGIYTQPWTTDVCGHSPTASNFSERPNFKLISVGSGAN